LTSQIRTCERIELKNIKHFTETSVHNSIFLFLPSFTQISFLSHHTHTQPKTFKKLFLSLSLTQTQYLLIFFDIFLCSKKSSSYKQQTRFLPQEFYLQYINCKKKWTRLKRWKMKEGKWLCETKQVLRSTILSSTIILIFFDNSRMGRF
jgi:hypothetical protein